VSIVGAGVRRVRKSLGFYKFFKISFVDKKKAKRETKTAHERAAVLGRRRRQRRGQTRSKIAPFTLSSECIYIVGFSSISLIKHRSEDLRRSSAVNEFFLVSSLYPVRC
tara:strand:- start:342 stop:668 length:327 start_codon:yes stop_codon:yes gene_type:complete